MQRYFDGIDWTEHYAAMPPAAAGVTTIGGNNNVALAIVTILTCGLFLPIWLLILATEKKQTRAVDVYGNVIQPPADPSKPGERGPTSTPSWMEALPGPPALWVAIIIVGVIALGLAMAITSGR